MGTAEEAGAGFQPLRPWPDEVRGLDLLERDRRGVSNDLLASRGRRCRRWPVVPRGAIHGCLSIFPTLALVEPCGRCGKTRTQRGDRLPRASRLARRGPEQRGTLPSDEAYRPTLLLDETDNLDLKKRGDLLALSEREPQSEHGMGSAVPNGEDFAIRNFSTWAPKVFAGIGELPIR